MNDRLTSLLEAARALAATNPLEVGIAAGAGLVVVFVLLALLARRVRRAPGRAAGTAPAEEAAAERQALEAVAVAAVPEPMEAPPGEEAEGLPVGISPAPPLAEAPPPRAEPPSEIESKPLPPELPPEPAVSEAEAVEPPEGFFQRLRRGLARTQGAFVGRLDSIFAGREKLDEEAFEEIEEVLYTADLGVATATRLMETLREQARKGGGAQALREALRASVEEILSSDGKVVPEDPAEGPRVVMFVGVNGVGKTTTIGKVGAQYVSEGKRVILAAADTFRAAAIEQLEIWGGRIGAQVIKQSASSDPSAVAFDAVAAARSRGADVLLVDTAGRLHTKVNLMEELKKMKRILGRELPGAPHEIILVLDATTGQNALSQARQFNEALGVTGIALTKLDGTAKGGIVIAVHEELGLPIRYIGVGEKVNDLRPFDAHAFVEALFTRE